MATTAVRVGSYSSRTRDERRARREREKGRSCEDINPFSYSDDLGIKQGRQKEEREEEEEKGKKRVISVYRLSNRRLFLRRGEFAIFCLLRQ